MTNEQLLEKINQELDGKFQIGFHNLTVDRYKGKALYGYDKELYTMNPEDVTNYDIVSSILKKGLYVSDRWVGLSSTVRFQNELRADCFNYLYWNHGSSKKYVIIVMIPTYIYIGDREYYLGDMTEPINLANYSLFCYLLPKEFIYGYYVRDVKAKETVVGEGLTSTEFIFEEDFDFFSNPNFYGYMTDKGKEQFWIDYFKQSDIDISILKAVNYPNLFNRLFQNSRNRYSIQETRKQFQKVKKSDNCKR